MNSVRAPNPISLASFIILSSLVRIGLISGSPPSGASPNPYMHLVLLHTCYMHRPSHFCRLDHPNNIWWEVQTTKFVIMQFLPVPCYLVQPRIKYFPHHPVVKHPQFMFRSPVLVTLQIRKDIFIWIIVARKGNGWRAFVCTVIKRWFKKTRLLYKLSY